MKTYKIGCIIALVLCLVAIIASFIFKYTFSIELLDDIFIGVFASAFVVFITYLTEYFIKKQEIICWSLHYGREYHNLYLEFLNDLFKGKYDNPTSFVSAAIEKIRFDKEINLCVKNLIRKNEETLVTVKGFFPFFKISKSNLEVMRLFFVLSDLNDIMVSFDYEYKVFNSIIYNTKPRPQMFSEENLKVNILKLSKPEDNPCEKLAKLLDSLYTKHIKTIGR